MVEIGCAFTELRSPPPELQTWERCQKCGSAWDEMPTVYWRFSGYAEVSTAQDTLLSTRLLMRCRSACMAAATCSCLASSHRREPSPGFRV